MANNISAYIGLEYFDHVLYTARILRALGMKVLLIDHSESQALQSMIPQPCGISCQENIITYKELDFTCAILSEEICEQYDDILITYGLKKPKEDIGFCNRAVFITDLYRFHHIRIGEYIRKYSLDQIINRDLLILDAVDIKITTEMIEERMGLTFAEGCIRILFRDERDYYNSILNHTNGSFYVTGFSKQFKKLLLQVTGELYPMFNNKQLTAACRRVNQNKHLSTVSEGRAKYTSYNSLSEGRVN